MALSSLAPELLELVAQLQVTRIHVCLSGTASFDSSFSGARRPLIPEFLSCFLLDLLCKSSATQVLGGVRLGGKDPNGADTEGQDLSRSILNNGPGKIVRNGSRASPQPLSGVPLPSPRPAPVREMRRGHTMHAHTRTATFTCWLLAHMYVLACSHVRACLLTCVRAL